MRRTGGRSGWAVAASERAYRALTRAYPEELRAGYGREMERCFGDLCRREVGRRGVPGLLLLWARTLPELLLTALKERSIMIARNATILPASPTGVGRWGTRAALLGGFMGVAYNLVWAAREALGGSMAGFNDSGLTNLADLTVFFSAQLLCVLGLFGIYGAVSARSGRPGGLAGAGAVLGGVAAGSWLAVGAYQFAKGLAAWPGVNDTVWYGWELRLTGALFAVAAACWLAGLLLLGAAAHRRALALPLRFMPVFVAALWPASFAMSFLLLPENYGLNGTGVGNAWYGAVSTLSSMLPFLGSLVLGMALLRDGRVTEAHPAAPAARRGPTIRSVARVLGVAGPAAARGPAGEREKELLGALRHHRELTVAGAALETSLTVEEADRMLSALAAKGHLEVRVERGRLLYSLWEGDVPL